MFNPLVSYAPVRQEKQLLPNSIFPFLSNKEVAGSHKPNISELEDLF